MASKKNNSNPEVENTVSNPEVENIAKESENMASETNASEVTQDEKIVRNPNGRSKLAPTIYGKVVPTLTNPTEILQQFMQVELLKKLSSDAPVNNKHSDLFAQAETIVANLGLSEVGQKTYDTFGNYTIKRYHYTGEVTSDTTVKITTVDDVTANREIANERLIAYFNEQNMAPFAALVNQLDDNALYVQMTAYGLIDKVSTGDDTYSLYLIFDNVSNLFAMREVKDSLETIDTVAGIYKAHLKANM